MRDTKDISLVEQTQVKTGDDIIITESNFTDYFFDVRNHQPLRGQVIARYHAIAQFIDGKLKRDVLDLLLRLDEGGAAAAKVLRKLGGATDRHSLKLAREMTQDLLSGMSFDEVAAKEYPYEVEFFWYTERKYIPTGDPHWSCLTIQNLEDFLEKTTELPDGRKITTRILSQEEAMARSPAVQAQLSDEGDH
jgi:hypothetical protein